MSRDGSDQHSVRRTHRVASSDALPPFSTPNNNFGQALRRASRAGSRGRPRRLFSASGPLRDSVGIRDAGRISDSRRCARSTKCGSRGHASIVLFGYISETALMIVPQKIVPNRASRVGRGAGRARPALGEGRRSQTRRQERAAYIFVCLRGYTPRREGVQTSRSLMEHFVCALTYSPLSLQNPLF